MIKNGDRSVLNASEFPIRKQEHDKAINPRVGERSQGEREIYDAKGGYAQPGTLVRKEGS